VPPEGVKTIAHRNILEAVAAINHCFSVEKAEKIFAKMIVVQSGKGPTMVIKTVLLVRHISSSQYLSR
jgi:hypothetical protein